jgi:poly-gamma-glutamate synthesis protein (capsule biosynthesis protein)
MGRAHRTTLVMATTLALTACSSAAGPTRDASSAEDTASTSPSEEPPVAGRTPSRDATGDEDTSPGPQEAAGSEVAEQPTARVARIGPALRERMTASHRPGCPVPLRDLRYLRLPFVGFDGEERLGEMVVAARHAEDVVAVFQELFEARFPIRRMVLVDEYDGDDGASMAANNTSAYNCRTVAGTDRWSEHAFGAAVDINPVQNPYVQGSSYDPAEAAPYVEVPRGARARPEPGVIVAGDVVVRAFERIGWEWGGTWTSSKDYQHFSAGGG